MLLVVRTKLCFYNEIGDLFYLFTWFIIEFGKCILSLDHLPANNKSEIFAPLDFAADALALRRLCPW